MIDELARCGPWLQPALDRDGKHSLAEVSDEILSGKALLWAGAASAAVTEQCRDLHIWLAGGSLDELKRMEADCARWGREHGFERLTIEGRKGWQRALVGYRTLLVRDL